MSEEITTNSAEAITIYRNADLLPINFYADGKPIFSIHPDGRIEKKKGFTTQEEESLNFWKAIEAAYAQFIQAPQNETSPAVVPVIPATDEEE